MTVELDDDQATAVRFAVRAWMPGQAQYVLDEANKTITVDPDWAEEDELAGQCEQLALAVRAMANIGHAQDALGISTPALSATVSYVLTGTDDGRCEGIFATEADAWALADVLGRETIEACGYEDNHAAVWRIEKNERLPWLTDLNMRWAHEKDGPGIASALAARWDIEQRDGCSDLWIDCEPLIPGQGWPERMDASDRIGSGGDGEHK